MRTKLLAAAALAALCVAGPAAAGAATGVVSANWAGYAVTARGRSAPFHSVSAAWVEPTARCQPRRRTFAVFWIGIGGFRNHSRALEQSGTEADCTSSGGAVYSAWYELLPAAPVTVRLRIAPGDVIAASVSVSGRIVHVRLLDRTSGRLFSRTLRMRAPDTSSAEWIAEAPAECGRFSCRVLPLTDFGTVIFGSASASARRRAHPIGYPGWAHAAISLDGSSAAAAAAAPTALANGGSAFAVIANAVRASAHRRAAQLPATPR